MRELVLGLFFILFYSFGYGQQFIGVGGQYTDGADGQFAVSASFVPYFMIEPASFFVTAGGECTTSGRAKMSGLQIKPVQAFFTVYSERLKPYSLVAGLDAGYLVDTRNGKKNAFLLTPNVYADYYCFFAKSGYEWDAFNGRGQFYIRAGIGFGLGLLGLSD